MPASSAVALAGDDVVLNCTVTLQENFVSQPSRIIFSHSKEGTRLVTEDRSNATQSNITSSGDNVYSTSLMIDSIKTSDARMYFCLAEFSNFNVTAVGNLSLSIKSKIYKCMQLYIIFTKHYLL